MISGREPTLLTRHVLALAIAFWPAFSGAAAAQTEQSNSWAAGSTAETASAPADPGNSPAPATSSTQPPNAWAPPSAEEAAQRPGDEWPDPNRPGWYEEREEPEAWDEQEPSREHRVPSYSLWFGPALSWSVPFGDLWGLCSGFDAYGQCAAVQNVPTSNYFGSGPALELDAGVRLGRHYNVFALWERTWFSAGKTPSAGGARQDSGDSDFVALGLRVTTTPEKLGFVLDIAVGTRRMRARWEDGTELQLTDAPFETRLGIGADVRLDEHWSFTPLVHLGLGSFGKAEWLLPNGTIQPASAPGDVALTHGWVGLQVSAHADILGSKD